MVQIEVTRVHSFVDYKNVFFVDSCERKHWADIIWNIIPEIKGSPINEV